MVRNKIPDDDKIMELEKFVALEWIRI